MDTLLKINMKGPDLETYNPDPGITHWMKKREERKDCLLSTSPEKQRDKSYAKSSTQFQLHFRFSDWSMLFEAINCYHDHVHVYFLGKVLFSYHSWIEYCKKVKLNLSCICLRSQFYSLLDGEKM